MSEALTPIDTVEGILISVVTILLGVIARYWYIQKSFLPSKTTTIIDKTDPIQRIEKSFEEMQEMIRKKDQMTNDTLTRMQISISDLKAEVAYLKGRLSKE